MLRILLSTVILRYQVPFLYIGEVILATFVICQARIERNGYRPGSAGSVAHLSHFFTREDYAASILPKRCYMGYTQGDPDDDCLLRRSTGSRSVG